MKELPLKIFDCVAEERMPYGVSKLLTKEQKNERRRMLQKRWRAKNKKLVSEYNHKWYIIYKTNKPYIVTCSICGQRFKAARDWYKICPDCMKAKHKEYADFLTKRTENVKAKKDKYQAIINLLLEGLPQKEIAKIVGTSQATVSYVNVTRRVRTENGKGNKGTNLESIDS